MKASLLTSCLARFIMSVLLVLSLQTRSLGEEDASMAELKQLLEAVAADTLSGKIDTIFAHAHPALIAMIGGEEKAKAILPKLMRADFEMLEQKGFKITSFEAGDPEIVRKTEDGTFVLIPTTLIAEGELGKFTAKSHTLATRKKGESEKWHFFRLGLPEARVRQMIPELPADFSWPVKQPPQFEKR